MSEMTGTTSGESPLVPNRTIKRIYEGMVGARLLSEFVQSRRGKSRLPSIHGQEACRASALVDLTDADLVSDHAGHLTSALLRGADTSDLVQKAVSKHSTSHNYPGLLPQIKNVAHRLHLALGAAAGLKQTKSPGIVVVFAENGEAKASLWREILHFAAQQELAMLFVSLPLRDHPKKHSEKILAPFELSKRSTKAGVPGIPVDASDAIALYRVVQESIGRARAGGGPALMECIPLTTSEHTKANALDPIAAMGATLLKRKVCEERWLMQVQSSFQERLDAL